MRGYAQRIRGLKTAPKRRGDYLSKNLPLKKFSFPNFLAVRRKITQPSGQTMSLVYLPLPPRFSRSPPLRTDSISGYRSSMVLEQIPWPHAIHRAAIGAGVCIANFFPVATVALCFGSAQETDYLYFKLIFFGIPFFHR